MLTGKLSEDIGASVRRMAKKNKKNNSSSSSSSSTSQYGSGMLLQIVDYKLTLNTASYSRSL